MKEEFPKDDFGVIIENNSEEIINYLISKGFLNNKKNGGGGRNNSYYFVAKNSKEIDYYYFTENPTSKTYTLQQLKQLDNMKKTREIEYYIVKVDALYGKNGNLFIRYEKIYNTNKESLPYFKSLGLTENPNILEPVYAPEKPKEVIVNMGSFNLTVKPEGIFHKNENILKFVEIVYGRANAYLEHVKIANYDFHTKDVILSKTGCENTETKLSQWLAVYEEYLKIKQ